jgi:cytochrome c-type biogenesis protein CcmE
MLPDHLRSGHIVILQADIVVSLVVLAPAILQVHAHTLAVPVVAQRLRASGPGQHERCHWLQSTAANLDETKTANAYS